MEVGFRGGSSSKYRIVGLDLKKLTEPGGARFMIVDANDNDVKEQDNIDVEIDGSVICEDDLCTDEENDTKNNDFHRKKYLDDGSKSLVFNTTMLEDIQEATSFDSFLEMTVPITDDGEVQKMVLKKGNGSAPKKFDRIWIHYIMFAEKDPPVRSPFDSTKFIERLHTSLLNGGMIRCMNRALESMEYEEVSLFISTPGYAYGKFGHSPRIPPDSRILLIIELVNIDASSEAPLFRMTDKGEQNIEFLELCEQVQAMKGIGDNDFNNRDYARAMRKYCAAIDLLEADKPEHSADIAQKKLLLYFLYSNQAETFLQLQMPQKACENFGKVIAQGIPMLNYKLYFRNVRALIQLKDFTNASKCLNEMCWIKPKPGVADLAYRDQLLCKIRILLDSDKSGQAKIATRLPPPPPMSIRNQFSAAYAIDVLLGKKPSIFKN